MNRENRGYLSRFFSAGAFVVAAIALFLTPTGAGAAGPQAFTASIPDTLAQSMGLQVFDNHITAPDLSAPDSSGKIRHLSDFHGNLVVLNFWATWCVPCRKEIPALDAFSKKWAGKSVRVVSVAMDRKIDHVTEFMKKQPISYPVLLGRKGRIDSRYFGLGLPQTYLIDGRGYLIGRMTGPRDWLSPDASRLIRDIQAQDNGATR